MLRTLSSYFIGEIGRMMIQIDGGTVEHEQMFMIFMWWWKTIQYIQQFWIPDTLESREYCGHFCFKSWISWASWILKIVSTDFHVLNQPPGAQASTNKLEYQPPRQQSCE